MDALRRRDEGVDAVDHDLRVVRAMSHKVMVMKQGDVVEQGSAEDVFDRPQTEYTRTLVAAAH